MIDIKELKQNIETNNYHYPILILVSGSDKSIRFLCDQYTNEILALHQKNLKVGSIEEILLARQNIFSPSDDFIYCKVDEFDLTSTTILKYNKILIICNKISSNAKSLFEEYIVKFPELENWHIKDYVTSNCSLNKEAINYLIDKCNDLYQLDNELSKINIFEENSQQYIFNDLITDNFLSENNEYDVFNLANPIVNKSYSALTDVWKAVKLFDSDPMLLLSVLINQYKTIIDVFLYPNSTPEICGISQKRFNAIKFYNKNYTKTQLVEIYKFLTEVDKRLKNGELPNEDLLDYIIINVIQKGNL